MWPDLDWLSWKGPTWESQIRMRGEQHWGSMHTQVLSVMGQEQIEQVGVERDLRVDIIWITRVRSGFERLLRMSYQPVLPYWFIHWTREYSPDGYTLSNLEHVVVVKCFKHIKNSESVILGTVKEGKTTL